MTTAAQTNFGAFVKMAPTGETPVLVAELLSLDPPPETRGVIDVTTHDSDEDGNGGVPMEFIGEKVYDPGEFQFTIHYIMNSDGDLALLAAVRAGLYDFELGGNAASGQRQLSGSGIVLAYTPGPRPVTGVQTATVRVKRSGVWTPEAAS